MSSVITYRHGAHTSTGSTGNVPTGPSTRSSSVTVGGSIRTWSAIRRDGRVAPRYGHRRSRLPQRSLRPPRAGGHVRARSPTPWWCDRLEHRPRRGGRGAGACRGLVVDARWRCAAQPAARRRRSTTSAFVGDRAPATSAACRLPPIRARFLDKDEFAMDWVLPGRARGSSSEARANRTRSIGGRRRGS